MVGGGLAGVFRKNFINKLLLCQLPGHQRQQLVIPLLQPLRGSEIEQTTGRAGLSIPIEEFLLFNLCNLYVGGVVERPNVSLHLFYDSWVLQSPAVEFFHLLFIFSIHLLLCVTANVIKREQKVVQVAVQHS